MSRNIRQNYQFKTEKNSLVLTNNQFADVKDTLAQIRNSNAKIPIQLFDDDLRKHESELSTIQKKTFMNGFLKK